MDQWPEQAAVSEVLFLLQKHLLRSWLEKAAVTDESSGYTLSLIGKPGLF